jgi:hypothetical protein
VNPYNFDTGRRINQWQNNTFNAPQNTALQQFSAYLSPQQTSPSSSTNRRGSRAVNYAPPTTDDYFNLVVQRWKEKFDPETRRTKQVKSWRQFSRQFAIRKEKLMESTKQAIQELEEAARDKGDVGSDGEWMA